MVNFRQGNKISVHLNFQGAYVEQNINEIPEVSGVYVAYICEPLSTDGYYNVVGLLYIGKADKQSLKERISQHFRYDHTNWRQKYDIPRDYEIAYTVAEFDDTRLSDVEYALIFRNQPMANTEGKDKYIGKSWILSVNCEGAPLLHETNVVVRTAE